MTGATLSASYTTSYSACISIYSGITLLDIRDNILKNSMTTASGTGSNTAYAVYCASANTAFTSINYNDYYPDGINLAIGYLGSDQVFTTSCPSPAAAGTITGPTSVCQATAGHVYTVPAILYADGYTWTVPQGGTITTGANTNSITVSYDNSAVSGDVTVFGYNVCGSGPSSALAVTVNALPAGATIVDGEYTNHIKVDFALNAESGDITVYGENLCGTGQPSQPFEVNVTPIPPAPVASVDEFFVLHSSAPEGNQWYFNGALIEGATGQDYQAEQEGTYYTIVTINGCASDESNHAEVIFTGIKELNGGLFSIYPLPNDGKFTFTIQIPGEDTFTISLLNDLGIKVFELKDFNVDRKAQHFVDLLNPSTGVYTIVFRGSDQTVIRKILVTR